MFDKLFKKESANSDDKWLTLMAPFGGQVIPIEQVDDMVFAQKMVGDGVAIIPDTDTVVAPIAGTLTNLFPTGHAAGITTDDGIEVLVHVGLDTVELKGEGFERLAEQGQRVEVGTPLIRLNLGQLSGTARSLQSPIIITSMPKVAKLERTQESRVEAGQDWVLRVLPS